ncbi:LOG family protein [Arundinibacter roseus]|uniref:Cytokinin riboside 5'-monophosphate phosphoribohydrolase n=1 Tax=Arundinibacter roseus TaxID=2070510 RepID=A0A4R4KPR4_9BACT|nr:TIGR00730 family Rossman fold protein [Arundinibacter roseus]TDB68872.1 TIGR00730 family Rossman fold protein [Arundinibacter roseus]
MKSVVVYCGSNPGNKPVYKDVAYDLGKKLAAKEILTVYGGGNLGLMGTVADGVLENGGQVTGIIPNFLAKLEVAHKTLTELHFVDTMHERKAKMVSMSDGVIALAGGYGTLDELFEILAWSQLKIFHGPVGVLNTNGFYDHLIAHVDKMTEEGFLRPENRDLMLVADTVDELLEKMETFFLQKAENKPLDHTLYVTKPNA